MRTKEEKRVYGLILRVCNCMATFTALALDELIS